MSLDITNTFIRKFDIEDGRVISIHQSYVGDVGCVVWDAALVLSKFLIRATKIEDDKYKLVLKNCTVVEIGSGTAICSITAAVLG